MKLVGFFLLAGSLVFAETSSTLKQETVIPPSTIQQEPMREFRLPAQEDNVVTESSDGKSLIRTRRIQHPGAKDGLFLIDEDGVYHYKVDTVSRDDRSSYIRFISQSAPNITADVAGQELGYGDFYSGDSLTGLDFIYEWQPWKNFGKAGIQVGVGFSMASGKGWFANGTDTREPKEDFTFISIPLSAGLIYRFEYTSRQWVVPYITGGGIYYGLIEYRDDGENTIVGSPAAYGGGGLLFNITALNRDLAFIMDREYGFSNLWLTAEFRVNQSFSEDLDVSSDQISIGIGADY